MPLDTFQPYLTHTLDNIYFSIKVYIFVGTLFMEGSHAIVALLLSLPPMKQLYMD